MKYLEIDSRTECDLKSIHSFISLRAMTHEEFMYAKLLENLIKKLEEKPNE